MGNFVTAASMEHMLIRKTSNRMPRSKNPVFGEFSFDKQVEMQRFVNMKKEGWWSGDHL